MGRRYTNYIMSAPTVVTPDVLAKLKMAFLIGASDREACSYADIAPSTLYKYQVDNPGFSEQKDSWKQQPILKARQVLVKGLEDNPELALKYLERKLKSEFSLRTETTGADGEPIQTQSETTLSIDDRMAKLVAKLKDQESFV